MQDKSVVEYFAGIGLVRLGLEAAGWHIVYANDFDPRKQQMYEAYYSATEYDSRNIFEVEAKDVPKSLLATSSFPCIDLSLAGRRDGINGQHSSAFWGVVDILEKQGSDRPPLVMFENVPGWLTSNNGEDFRITVQQLNRLGYTCDVFSIDALRFTLQSRERIFLIGFLNGVHPTTFPAFMARDESLRTPTLVKAVSKNMDLGWGFLDVPALPRKRDHGLIEIMENLSSDDERWWSKQEVARHLDMMDQSHLLRVMNLAKLDDVSYRTVYRRKRKGVQRAEVRQTDTAGCLRTARGGSSRQIVIKMGRGQIKMRHMTPREYARLQGVPDVYPIPNNTIQALTGFGDAVAVPVIVWIGKNILNPLVGERADIQVTKQLAFEYG